jgi:P4 family phage/plasmid primase-like protien
MTADTNGHKDIFLNDAHRRELRDESAISHDVLSARGYRTIEKPTSADHRNMDALLKHYPEWAVGKNRNYPGLYVPVFTPTGERVQGQFKPKPGSTGKGGRKYASPTGKGLRLDVHPFNTGKIVDPTEEAWVAEGIKKADSLTSKGVCAVGFLGGVYGFRNSARSLGDWEDILIKGREWTVCYDADARTKPQVLAAMKRVANFLKYKGAKKVYYLIVPGEVNGMKVKGVDDYFAVGGTLEELKGVRTTEAPHPDFREDTFSDARLAETIADDVLVDQFMWVSGLGWLGWDGRHWAATTEFGVTEAVRQYVLDRFAEAMEYMRNGQGSREAIDGWRSMLGAGRMRAVLNLARGIVEHKAAELDHDLDLINTPGGVVDLQTGELLPPDPSLLMTKITKGSYRPGFTHPDWEKALQALPESERQWFQVRIGQAITGHPTPDGIMVTLQGGGENGKSALTTDGPVVALGDYASMASTKLFQAAKGTEHSEERATLRGKRLLIAEELTEDRALDVTALKQIQDVSMITARHVYQKNMTFPASHSLFTTTNYIPIVNETDHGTWRRLALLTFPFTFRKPGEPIQGDHERRGDPTLKSRIKGNVDQQHDAIVTWAVEGAMKWYANPRNLTPAHTQDQHRHPSVACNS